MIVLTTPCPVTARRLTTCHVAPHYINPPHFTPQFLVAPPPVKNNFMNKAEELADPSARRKYSTGGEAEYGAQFTFTNDNTGGGGGSGGGGGGGGDWTEDALVVSTLTNGLEEEEEDCDMTV